MADSLPDKIANKLIECLIYLPIPFYARIIYCAAWNDNVRQFLHVVSKLSKFYLSITQILILSF